MLFTKEEWERIKKSDAKTKAAAAYNLATPSFLKISDAPIPESGGRITPLPELFSRGAINLPKRNPSIWEKILPPAQKYIAEPVNKGINAISALTTGPVRGAMEDVTASQRRGEGVGKQLLGGVSGFVNGPSRGIIDVLQGGDKYTFQSTLKDLPEIIGGKGTSFDRSWNKKGVQSALGWAGLGLDALLGLDLPLEQLGKIGKAKVGRTDEWGTLTKGDLDELLGRRVADTPVPTLRIGDPGQIKGWASRTPENFGNVERAAKKSVEKSVEKSVPMGINLLPVDKMREKMKTEAEFAADAQGALNRRLKEMLDETMFRMETELEMTETGGRLTSPLEATDRGSMEELSHELERDAYGRVTGMNGFAADERGFIGEALNRFDENGRLRTLLPDWLQSAGIRSKAEGERAFRAIRENRVRAGSKADSLLDVINGKVRDRFGGELADIEGLNTEKKFLDVPKRIDFDLPDRIPAKTEDVPFAPAKERFMRKQEDLDKEELLKSLPYKKKNKTFLPDEQLMKGWGKNADKGSEIRELKREIDGMERNPQKTFVNKLVSKAGEGSYPHALETDIHFLRRQGPHAVKIADKLENYERRVAVKKADVLRKLKDGFAKAGIKEKDLAKNRAFQDAIWKLQEGGGQDLLYKSVTNKAGKVIDDAVRDINKAFREEGLEVYDAAKGVSIKPTEEKSFFPRILSDRKALAKNQTEFKKLMIERGVVDDELEAEKLIKNLISTSNKEVVKAGDKASHMSFARKLDIRTPEEMRKFGFEMNPLVAYEKWAEGASKAVSYAEEFGKSGVKTKGQIMDYLLEGAVKDGANVNEIIRIINEATHGIEGADPTSFINYKLPKFIRSVQVMNKLSPKTALSQITQMTTINALLDEKSALNGMRKAFTKEGVKLAEDSGALDLTLIAGEGGGKLTSEYLRLIGMAGADRKLRTIAANAGADYAMRMAEEIASGNTSAIDKIKKIVPSLKTRGLSAVKATGKLSRDQLLEAAYHASLKTQFSTSPMYLPKMMTRNEWSKVIYQFKPYLVGQSSFLLNEVTKEAAKGNYKPLARYVYGSLLTGLANATGRELYSRSLGNDPREVGLKEALYNGPGFGTLSSVGGAVSGGGYSLMSSALGPTGSDLARGASLYTFLRDVPKDMSPEDAKKRASDKLRWEMEKSLPIVRDAHLKDKRDAEKKKKKERGYLAPRTLGSRELKKRTLKKRALKKKDKK